MRSHPRALAGSLPVAALTALGLSAAAHAQSLTAMAAPLATPVVAAPAPRPHPAAAIAWHGTIGGAFAGTVTMLIERVGVPEEPWSPSWPIVTRWKIDARDPTYSFAAQLFGSARDDGTAHLVGIVTSGYRAGAEVEIDVRGGSSGSALIRIGR